MLTSLIIVKSHTINKLYANSVGITTTIISVFTNLQDWLPEPQDLVKEILSGVCIGIGSWAVITFINWFNKKKTINKIRKARLKIKNNNAKSN